MGASTSKQLTKFQDTLKNEIDMSADASADCNAVQTISVKFSGNMEACNFTAQNTCVATTQIDIQQMSEAIKNVTQQLSAENKTSDIVLGQANTSIQESDTLIERINEIATECTATSNANADQNLQIEIENCKDTPFSLINGGDAQANCVLANVQKEILTFDSTQTAENTAEGVNLTEFATSGLMSFAPSVLCVVVVVAAGFMGGGNNNNNNN